jgi:type IV secretion system protein VirB10
MDDPNKIPPAVPDRGSIPSQPQAEPAIKKSRAIVIALGAIILLIGLANITSLFSGNKREAPQSALATRPIAPNAQQVTSFETQQRLLAQRDEADRTRQQQLAAQMAQLQQEQAVPGPESPTAAPMTAAQRQAIYGDSPNAPQKTSNVSQAQAEAKQRALAREKERQNALNSDTVAIDFARGGTNPTPGVTTASTTASAEEGEPKAASREADSGSQQDPQEGGGLGGTQQRPASFHHVEEQQSAAKDPMAAYSFDGYQGRLYRVFEGTVFEGVVTNHVDGGFAGPILVMLTTDYYSHDHQQLLLPQGTRLIGNVQSVGSAQQRKLFVVFNRAVCPDGFSIDLNKYLGLDPLGTTGLATNVNNHYLSSFAAAAALGGLGGLAQIGSSGNILDTNAQIRNGISEQTAQQGEQILNHFLNRLPVITVKEGSRARVYINRDILIPSYAEHRVDPAL